MTTPSIEERLRRLTANPGQPATKADLAELWSALRIRDSERQAEMNRRESERDLRAIKFQSEMRTRESEFQSEMRTREWVRDLRAIKFRSEMRTRESERHIRASEFRSEMRTHALKLQAEMRTRESERKARESERMIEHYERKRRKSEKRWDTLWRGSIILYVVLFVAAVIILATSFF